MSDVVDPLVVAGSKMRNERDANEALFMASVNKVCDKACAKSARENRATANNGSAAYWRNQEANRTQGVKSWDVLTKWLFPWWRVA